MHQLFQRGQKARLSLGLWPPATARPTNAAFQARIRAPQLRKSTPDRTARDTCRLRHRHHSTPACGASLGCCQQPTRPLVEMGRKRLEARLDSDDINQPGSPSLIRTMNQTDPDASSILGRSRPIPDPRASTAPRQPPTNRLFRLGP